MIVRWQKLFTNFLFWALFETALNFVGLDTIADYSEFLSIKKELATMTTDFSLCVRYSLFSPD